MITLNNVSKKFETFHLKNINLEITQGEYFVILGPSGAGKTVVLELLAKFEKQDAGIIEGNDGKRVGFIYQDYMLFPHLSVYENISYGLKIAKIEKEKRKKMVLNVSDKLNISHLLTRDVSSLSGGEKQRVAIARAVVVRPDIFLIDEPTAALDQNKKAGIQKLFSELHKETKATFIHVTHDFEEALAMADRIGVLLNGEIVQVDKPENIFQNPKNKTVADFIGYRNVYKGSIKNNIIKINEAKIYANHEDCDFVYIAIKADDILVSKQKLESSARNSLKGIIIDFKKKLSHVELVIDAGFLIEANITNKSFQELDLKLDMEVFATFKSSAILFFKH
ncbi:MAG: ATP-binding cassette domain-containing protein [Pseudomonadota bacterium]